MVADHPVTIGEGRLVQQRREPIGKMSRMDEDDRLPGSPYLKLEFDALQGSSLHGPLVHHLPPWRRQRDRAAVGGRGEQR